MLDFCCVSNKYVGSLVFSMAFGCIGAGFIVTSLGLGFGFACCFIFQFSK